MTDKTAIFIIVVVAVLCLSMGVVIGRGTAPSIVIGAETTLITIPVRDTITVESLSVRYVTRTVYDTLIVSDTVYNVQKDSLYCYEFDNTMQDSAYIKCTACTDVPDLTVKGYISYSPAPAISKEIFRVDTIHINQIERDWKMYIIAGAIGALGGVIISNRR